MDSYVIILLALLSLYPFYLSLRLFREKGYRNICVFLFIFFSLLIINGGIHTLFLMRLLSSHDIRGSSFIINVLAVIGLYFAVNGIQDIFTLNTERNRVVVDLNAKLERFEAIQFITKVLASPVLTLHEKLQKALEMAIKQVHSERGSILIRNTEGGLEVMAATDSNLIGINKTLMDGVSGWVIREAKTLNVEDIKLDERFNKDRLDKYKKDSFLSVPIKVREEVMGVLNVSDKVGADIFKREDEEILINMIEKIGSFIENAEIYEQLEEERERVVGQLSKDK